MNWIVPALSATRRGVGHAHDGGEAARGGGVRAGGDGFLVRLAGLAEVDVDVDEAGAGDEAAGVDLLRAFFRRGGERRRRSCRRR